ncbi:nuclease [Pseudoxanthomonas gei]|uniref:Nuclease n=1 Tax=Pseudoxanthomonas gei TaxID=1383030 RepID=A0ABX0AFX0_9GAMM|nr:Calx-beta domain-containing protein [Pseudoxanthomonas gei]NDK38396.1 nuclease [Pseudoxanthomonas gei]
MRKGFLRDLALVAMGLGMAGAAHAQVVISQVYGGGGNTGAPLRSDYIELHNNSASSVSLTGWSVQYASSTGTSWQVTPLAGTIAAGGYYLVKQADGANTSAPALPTPDATGTIAMAAGAGKVALSNGAAALSGVCPTGNIDFVGFGTAANCSEGAAPTATLTATTAALRAGNGCTDSNNNGADFAVGAPAPRNSASAALVCGGGGLPILSVSDLSQDEASGNFAFTLTLTQAAGPGGVSVDYATADGTAQAGSDYTAASGTATISAGAVSTQVVIAVSDDNVQEADETFFLGLGNVSGALLGDAQAQATIVNDDVTLVPIHQIQGSGATSPLANQLVSTTGIVTGRKSNGFFLQTRDVDADADPASSQGVYVFTSVAPPAAAAVGNEVRVSGTVIEYVPTADPNQLPLTEITGSPTVALLSTGNPLPAPVPLTTTFPSPNGALDQLERLEGMRVSVPSATVVAPTQGNTSEPNATGSSNGLLNIVVTGVPRPFREPGIQAPDPAPAGGSIPPIPRWDFNPELLTLDSDSLGGPGFILDLPAGALIEGLTGPLDYGFRRYTLLRDPGVPITTSGGATPTAARAASGDEFTVAAYNLERFFDTVNDPAIGEPVLTATAFSNRLSKASLAIRNFLNTPDILATVEVENQSTLQTLADRVNADAVAAGQANPQYAAYLQEGNDVGGIDVGFLVKAGEVGTGIARVQVLDVTQYGKGATWTEPSGTASLLNDRPPLALRAVVHYADGRSFPVTAIAVHQRSLNDVDSIEPSGPTTLGDRVRQKRQRQAEYLAGVIQQMQVDEPARRIVTLGDFNAFAFNDGLADTMNVVTGTPTPDDQTAVPGDGIDLVNPDLVNLGVLEPAEERYSFVFGGNAQTLDHVLANEELILASSAFALDHARINADFPEIARNDVNSPSRLSDHDPVVAYFEVRHRADLSVTVAANASPITAGQVASYSATVSNLGPDTAQATGVGFALDAALPGMTVTAPAGWTCDAPQVASGTTSIACFHGGLANGATAAFTINAASTAAQAGTTLKLAVAATSQSLDPVAGNDQATASVVVNAAPAADLGLQITGPATVPASTFSLSYTATLRNLGNAIALQPVVEFSGNTMAATSTLTVPAGWQCTRLGSSRVAMFRCSAASLAIGASASFVIKVNAKPTPGNGMIEVEGAATTPSPETTTVNNSAIATTRVL